ncbi:MAG TPA: hypothetical protein V6C72_13780, partial [Chroococcales cyanobacterium]
PDFLRYKIGAPAPDSIAGSWTTSKHYMWYQNNQQGLHYELFQEMPQPNIVTEATFVLYLTDLDMDLGDVEDKFGQAQKKYYDQKSCPTEEFCFVPYTLVRFTQPHHSKRVCRVFITYKGPALPKPQVADIETAKAGRKMAAMEHIKNENWRESLPLLYEHIAEEPQDMEAHIALAQAYTSMSNINAAIDQYKFALANANGDQNVTAQATKGLQDLRVLPTVDADTQELHHEYQLEKDGEGFHAGDVQTKGAQIAQAPGSKQMQNGEFSDLQPSYGMQPYSSAPVGAGPMGMPMGAPMGSLTGSPTNGLTGPGNPMAAPPVGSAGSFDPFDGPDPF